MKFPKRKPYRSQDYLDHARQRPCCAPGCREPAPSDPHHCSHPDVPRDLTMKGMGQKAQDCFVIPLCRLHHRFLEDKGHLPGMTVAETHDFIAIEQLKLMAQWITSGDEEIF